LESLIIEYQYLAPVTVFLILYKKSNIIFEQCEAYQKGGFRNRCIVAGGAGPVQLSVPLLHGRDQKRPVSDVYIDNSSPWQERHWRTIESCYRKSPWYDYYAPALEQYYERHYDLLINWNRDLFNWVIAQINWKGEIGTSTRFEKEYSPAAILDLRNRILPRNYQQFSCVPYRQVFEERTGFLANLSIIDLLFCEGKNAANYLDQNDFMTNL
jgi:hypothetical protein